MDRMGQVVQLDQSHHADQVYQDYQILQVDLKALLVQDYQRVHGHQMILVDQRGRDYQRDRVAQTLQVVQNHQRDQQVQVVLKNLEDQTVQMIQLVRFLQQVQGVLILLWAQQVQLDLKDQRHQEAQHPHAHLEAKYNSNVYQLLVQQF